MGTIAPADEKQVLVEELAEARALIVAGDYEAALERLASVRESARALVDAEVLGEMRVLARAVWLRAPRGSDATERADGIVRVVAARLQPRWLQPRWLLLGAVCAVLAAAVPSLIGVWLNIVLLKDWGVVATYVGISWVVPGVLVGLAVSAWSREHNLGYPRILAVGAGVAVGLILLLLSTAYVSNFGTHQNEQGSARRSVTPTLPSPRSQAVVR